MAMGEQKGKIWAKGPVCNHLEKLKRVSKGNKFLLKEIKVF
jgi:hypothetical protein